MEENIQLGKHICSQAFSCPAAVKNLYSLTTVNSILTHYMKTQYLTLVKTKFDLSNEWKVMPKKKYISLTVRTQ